MTVLVTGYEPFGDHEANPSADLARRLDGETVAGHGVAGHVLPVVFEEAGDELRRLVDDHRPAAVVATGLAGGRAGVSVERVGVNANDHAGTPDNADAEPHDERIRDGDAPAAYFATLPVVEAVEAVLARGIPARVSNTAGTHLCNNALYTVRAHVEREGLDVPAGFVHLPYTPAQAAAKADAEHATAGRPVEPSLPLGMQVEAVETVIETTLDG